MRSRAVRVVAYTGLSVFAVAALAGGLEYRHLSANIRTAPLNVGVSSAAASSPTTQTGAGPTTKSPSAAPAPEPHTPLNLLLIGSDTRDNPADCAIGHDCGPGANADVELLVHVSADRSSATVMSIPRDTMTELPACVDPATGATFPAQFGQINGTLTAGPGCTVAAVEKLTGVSIDHFLMVDFVGVIAMSDAIGGVPVCVSANVYDTYSHLKLAAGEHVLQGAGALAFVRSRHGFGDGSDLGRTQVQHMFLSSMLQTLRSAGTLANPQRLLDLADAATKALTVDPELGGVQPLISLANDLNRVPAEQITYLTMPNLPDPRDSNRVIPSYEATMVFEAIRADLPVTDPSAAGSSSSRATGSGALPAPDETTNAPSAAATGESLLPAPSSSLLADPHRCAQVSKARAVLWDGVLMTPTRAYELAAEVPDSAA